MYVLAGVLVTGVVYFLFVALSSGLLLSPIVGALAVGYWRLVNTEAGAMRRPWPIALVAGAGCLIGALAGWAFGLSHHPGWDLVGCLPAVIVGVGVASLMVGGSGRCQLCKQAMRSDGPLTCPRCHDHVCSRPSCWNARYARCTRCHERGIFALPVADAWWTARVGPRVRRGECTHCYKEAHEADLRECGQCRWPMCTRCWDYMNGVCPRCQWTVPDLPADLAALVAATRRVAPPKAGHDRRRAGGAAAPPRPDPGGSRMRPAGDGDEGPAPPRRPHPPRRPPPG